MGLDDGRLLIRGSLLLGLAELLDETHGLALETALEPTAGAGMDELVVGCAKSSVHAGAIFMHIPQRTKFQCDVRSM